MAAAVDEAPFDQWLNLKLQELKTDETVFGAYITGILDSDDSSEEKSEALQGILEEIVESGGNINEICAEILDKWKQAQPKPVEAPQATSEELNDKLAKMLESQCLATVKLKEYTEEEKKIRAAILNQYSQMSDSDDEGEEGEQKTENLEKNINAQLVAEAEKQKREQARADSQKKKEKDKEDREKQKQLKEEKKEKRKTQKGERKR